MPAVDQHHSVLSENDAGVGLEVLADVNVDAVAELLELRSEILRKSGRAHHKSDERNQCRCDLDPHEAPPSKLTPCDARPSLTRIPVTSPMFERCPDTAHESKATCPRLLVRDRAKVPGSGHCLNACVSAASCQNLREHTQH